MAQITNIALDGNTFQVMQNPWYYVINGLCYTKSSFAPIPLANAYSATNNPNLRLTYDYGMSRDSNTPALEGAQIRNSVDPSIFYQFGNIGDTTTGESAIHKSTVKDDVLTTSLKGQSAQFLFNKKLHETDDYIYWLGIVRSVAYLTRMHKRTEATDSIILTNYGATKCADFLRMEGSNFYFMCYKYVTTSYFGQFCLIGVDYIKWNLTVVGDFDYYNMGISSPYVKARGAVVGTDYWHYASHAKNLIKFPTENLDPNVPPVLYTLDVVPSCYMYATDWQGGYLCVYDTYDTNGDLYLTIVQVREISGLTGGNTNDTLVIYTYKINEDDKTATLTQQLEGATCFKSMRYDGMLVTMHDTGVRFHQWNPQTAQWYMVTEFYGSIVECGFDLDKTFWYRDTNNQVYYAAMNQPITLSYEWEKDLYFWDAQDIDTYITCSVSNLYAEDIAANFVLTIRGNAVFTTTGTNTASVTVEKGVPAQVPVTITGNDLNITVQMKQI